MESIRSWMKEFLIIYLVLTILMHLAAAEQYKKYLRFFSGIILLAVLISPVLHLSGNSRTQKVLGFYEEFWDKLDSTKQGALELDSLQNSRLIQKYESAAEKEISSQAEGMGIAVSTVRVQLSDVYKIEKITVWLGRLDRQERSGTETSGELEKLDGNVLQEQQDRLFLFLSETYGLEEGQIFIY